LEDRHLSQTILTIWDRRVFLGLEIHRLPSFWGNVIPDSGIMADFDRVHLERTIHGRYRSVGEQNTRSTNYKSFEPEEIVAVLQTGRR
jgi:hypothetical protein